jgi:hypothetical protein
MKLLKLFAAIAVFTILHATTPVMALCEHTGNGYCYQNLSGDPDCFWNESTSSCEECPGEGWTSTGNDCCSIFPCVDYLDECGTITGTCYNCMRGGDYGPVGGTVNCNESCCTADGNGCRRLRCSTPGCSMKEGCVCHGCGPSQEGDDNIGHWVTEAGPEIACSAPA